MAFSASDLASIESAIMALMTGERVVRVTMGDKTIMKSEVDLSKLEAAAARLRAELGVTPTRAYAKNGGRAKL